MKQRACRQRGVWLAVLAATAVLAAAIPAWAQEPSPRELFRRMQQAYEHVSAYQCVLAVFSRNGKRTESVKIRFAFKKPGMLRARVLEGPGRGREVAVRKDGKIRGREGGILRPIKVAMDRDDRRLRNIRGVPVWDAEWGAFLQKIETFLSLPSAQATVRPGEDGCLVLDIRVPGPEKPERYLYFVDRASYLLCGGEIYEGDVLVSRVRCDEEKLNPDLPDGYFNM